MICGSTLRSLAVTDPAQVVLLVGLEVQGGHVVQAQAQVTAPGDAGQTGRRDPGAPVALDAAGQGPEQGAPGHRPDTELADHAGDLLLAGGLDAAGQRHLLEALVPAHRLTRPQALVRPGQRIPQQGAALGVDHRARDAGPGAQGLKIQGRLPRQCGDPVASGPHQNGRPRLVMGRAQVLHDPPHPVLLGHDLHGRGSRSGAHLPDERAHTPTLQPPISAPHPPPRPHHANEKPPSRRDVAKTGTSQDTRRALLKRMVAMVCRYVSEHSTVEQLVRAYAAGEYRSSIIFKDLRRTLEREAARPGLDDGGADARPAPGGTRRPTHHSTG